MFVSPGGMSKKAPGLVIPSRAKIHQDNRTLKRLVDPTDSLL
jgi:hypothetical protein